MRFIFKTDYEQDIRILKHSGYWWSYGLLMATLLAVPFVLGTYLQSQIVFVFIYAIVGVGLMILTGFTARRRWATPRSWRSAPTRRPSCRRTACRSSSTFRWPRSIAGRRGGTGRLPGAPPARHLSRDRHHRLAFIVEEVMARWEVVTNGNEGMRIKTIDLLGQPCRATSHPSTISACLCWCSSS